MGGYRIFVLGAILAAGFGWHYRIPEPTLLSFRVGQTFEDVVRQSTYPVLQHSLLPSEDPMRLQAGDIYVTEPAVMLRFNDAEHGFTLPPTRFAVVSFMHNVVGTASTSPMLKKLPFDQAVSVLADLQNQFQSGGWQPYQGHDSVWFDLTPDGRRRLYARMFEPPYWQEITLRVPGKYAMTFRLKCAEGCWTREPPYRFLIDVGIGHDSYADDDTAP